MTTAPRVYGIPSDDSPLAYNEDELVVILTDIYKHFIEICYLPEDGVSFPPQSTGRHALNVDYLRDELHLSARVISLLERLPYISRRDFPECEWYPLAQTVDYRDIKNARNARDPARISVLAGGDQERVPDLDFMRPGDVTLGFPADNSTCINTLILDTAANSIIQLSCYCEVDFDDVAHFEVPEQDGHYRNQPAYYAPTFLRDYYASLRSLEYFPAVGAYDIGRVPYVPWATISANIMRRYYGWSENFRRDAWREVVHQVSDEAWEADERLEKSLDSQKRREVYTEESFERATSEVVAILGLHGGSREVKP